MAFSLSLSPQQNANHKKTIKLSNAVSRAVAKTQRKFSDQKQISPNKRIRFKRNLNVRISSERETKHKQKNGQSTFI